MNRVQLLVVGGGPAGFAAARAYRRAGGEGAVAIVTDEGRMPYNRPPLTKELLRGEAGEAELPLESETWLSQQRMQLVSGRAVFLDPERRTVTLSGGRELDYDWCLLATGAEPQRLPVPGRDDPGVRVMRSLDDLRELNARLQPGVRVVVIGSGFIGCEIAASLRLRGHPVSLISDETAPNERRLGADAAREIADWLRGDGVKLVTGQPVSAIERHDGLLRVESANAAITGELVVMASGVSPRAELASGAGVKLRDGAVPVDATMRTACAHLLAAGDVCLAENAAAGRALRVEHWGEAMAHGEIAGRTAAGKRAAWDVVPGFWSTIGRRTLKYAAWGDGYDEAHFERRGSDGFAVSYGRDGKLVGVLAHNCDDEYERNSQAIADGALWPH